MADKPRIFISHSAGHPGEESTRTLMLDLKAALEQPGADGRPAFEVLLDLDGLQLGDYWRAKLNLWIGGCDAAVLLLTKRSIQSRFVAYEASLLSYRARTEPNFKLVPLLLEDIDERTIQASFLNPAQIHEIQGLRVGADQTAKAIDIVRDQLKTLARGQGPAERYAGKLAGTLGKLHEDDLEDIARAIDLEIGTWTLHPNVPTRVAMRMVGAGLAATAALIYRISGDLPGSEAEQKREVQKIVFLVAASWVDHRISERLPAIARMPDRSAALGGHKKLTAQMYVRVAALLAMGLSPTRSWPVAYVDAILGHQPQADLDQQVSTALAEALKMPATATRDAVREQVRLTLELPLPVFVAIRADRGLTVDHVKGLRTAFPGVTYLLFVGTDELNDDVVEGAAIEVFEPRLDPDSEDRFCTVYEDRKSVLIGGLD